MNRLIARVKHLRGDPEDYVALAVSHLGKIGTRTPMPVLTWVVVQSDASGIFVLSYTDCQTFAGDSWFKTLDEALRYANDEYGISKDDWLPVPDDVSSPVEFALESSDKNETAGEEV